MASNFARAPSDISAPSYTTRRISRSTNHSGSARSMPRREDDRSEEHTSELQSPCNLVCRLLLEKDKWERIRTSAPLKTPALYMSVFAAGDGRSPAGVPYPVPVPGVLQVARHPVPALTPARPTHA